MAADGAGVGGDGVLRGGQFFSRVARQERRDELLLSELWQPEAGSVPRHEHEVAYVTLVLAGAYAEGGRSGWVELSPFAAIYNPAGVAHASRIGNGGMRLFTIECRPRLAELLDARLPDRPVVDAGAGAMCWSAVAAFAAFRSGAGDPLVYDSLAAEMLGALAADGPVERKAPAWLGRVRDRLHATFCEPVRIRDLAAEAGVHPVHLARVFRAVERVTPGEYLQRLRVRAACELLRAPGATLAGVAAECGFADQAHLTRTFRRITGATPGRLRAALGDHGRV